MYNVVEIKFNYVVISWNNHVLHPYGEAQGSHYTLVHSEKIELSAIPSQPFNLADYLRFYIYFHHGSSEPHTFVYSLFHFVIANC